MKNTAIFLQDKLNDNDSWDVYCYSDAYDTLFTIHNKKERIGLAKREGFKFGFVLKSLKK